MAAQTITEPTLSNAEAYEWLAQQFYAMTGGDAEDVLTEIRSGNLTVEELLDGLNGVSDESMPVTVEQFEGWVGSGASYVR